LANSPISPDASANVDPAIEGLLEGDHNYDTVTGKIANIVLFQSQHRAPWWIMIGIGFLLLQVLGTGVTYLLFKGTGIWGIDQPVGWGFAIINFVWWIGIGHAGTLISAILLLLRQQWRTSINRFAEAMTLFAVSCAGLYPLIHTGRPWVAYWMFPYPNILGMWPQFRSPLLWDVFAVSTYATVSALFWFVGLIPDLASVRDRAESPIARYIFGAVALGWRGSARHWQRYETVYLILAGLSTPLVLSVHTVVSFDFSVGIVPGWHATIFPPYFVAGAVYAGFAMVLTLALPLRAWYNLKDFITMKHLDWMAKIMLTTGLIVFYGYCTEIFYSYLSGDKYEMYMMHNRQFGPYGPVYWLLIFCNGIMPQFLWSKKIRHSIPWLFGISMVVSVGMWLERFVIVATSLTRDFLPSSWGYYTPRLWDVLIYVGTIGQFIFLFFLFVRFVPMISIFEMRDLVYRKFGHHGNVPAVGDEATGVVEPAGVHPTIEHH
jgi:molybdopterin-containing oxidoreductase family membrane subunit